MNLRVRVVRCAGNHWFADIDDADDPQPDDPFWYRDRCRSQSEALRSACAELSALTDRVERGVRLTRVLEADLVNA
ncbi:MAG TPA: hypothetical protein VGD71_19800 [Kribbella sp.]|jgi:hypothetical protein